MTLNPHDPAPLYRQVIQSLRKRISDGELSAGTQLPGNAQLALEYGVSLITVKKALATLIQEGVLLSRVGKGTFVSASPQLASVVQPLRIGFVLRDLKSPFFSAIAHSVEDVATTTSFEVFLTNSAGASDKEEAQIAQLRRMGVSGLIIASMTHAYRATPAMKKMLRDGFPFVMVSYIEDPAVPFVGTDHELGGYLATEHLIKSGFRRIGYINGERGNKVGELRFKGFARALRENKRKVDKRLLYRLRLKGEWNDVQSGYEIGKSFARHKNRPDALFIYNDLAALGFEQGARESGLRVPEEVAIVGFDDIEQGRYANVPLSTVRQPTDRIGKEAVRVLLDMCAGKSVVRRITLSPTLVPRASTLGASGENNPQANRRQSA